VIPDARSVFSTTVARLASKPQTAPQARPLYAFFHDYESQYGELSQVRQLEKKMAELYPDDPKLKLFSSRFVLNSFNPTAIRPIISPATQAKPKPLPLPSIERPMSAIPISPRPNPALLDVKPSPKRPFEDVDSDHESAAGNIPTAVRYGQPPPKRLQRGESPLKGAAGRRLEQRMAMKSSNPGYTQPAPLPREVNFLLGIIPNADNYPAGAARFDPARLAGVLLNVDLNRAALNRPQSAHQGFVGATTGGYPAFR
jgi:cleavage stimulation factor subunit 3